MSQIKRNIIDNDDDSFDEKISWCEENLIKLLIIICLTMIAIGCAIALAMVLIKQMQRERALQAKKNTWSARLEECAPILKVAGPIIMNIIKVAFSLILI